MYANLVSEMAKKSITKRNVADVLNVHENTLKNKLDGKSKFNVEEGFVIRQHFFPDLSIEYLFAE